MSMTRPLAAAAIMIGLAATLAAAAETVAQPTAPSSPETTGSCSFTPPGGKATCLAKLSQGACRATGAEAGRIATWAAGQDCPQD
jgi:hypothetical protein